MIFHRLRLINKDQRGFTLTELLAALFVSVIIGAVITTTIFQIVVGSERTNNHMTALGQVQSAGFWISHDVQMAQSITPLGGGFPLTLTWIEWGIDEFNGNQHNVVYTFSSSKLQREHVTTDTAGTVIENNVTVVADHVTSANCEFIDNILTLTVTATVNGQSETRTYTVVPRPVAD